MKRSTTSEEVGLCIDDNMGSTVDACSNSMHTFFAHISCPTGFECAHTGCEVPEKYISVITHTAVICPAWYLPSEHDQHPPAAVLEMPREPPASPLAPWHWPASSHQLHERVRGTS